MQFSQEGLLSVENILANVLEEINEFDYRNVSRGWFIDKIQSALEELSFDAMFVELFDDYAFPSDTLKLKLPVNAFNLKEVYVYNGGLGQPSSGFDKVWWKRNVRRIFDGDYSARMKPENDPIYGDKPATDVENRLYCNCVNGIIDFSISCSSYGFVRIVYNGTYAPFAEVPFIPPMFKQYVHSFLVERYYRVMKGRDYRTYGVMWKDSVALLGKEQREAMVRASRLDKKFADDMKQYIASMNTNGPV